MQFRSLTVWGYAILRQDPVVTDKSGLVECAPLDSPVRQHSNGNVIYSTASGARRGISMAGRARATSSVWTTERLLCSHDPPHLLDARLVQPQSPIRTAPLAHTEVVSLYVKVPARHSRCRLVGERVRAEWRVVGQPGHQARGEIWCGQGEEAVAEVVDYCLSAYKVDAGSREDNAMRLDVRG